MLEHGPQIIYEVTCQSLWTNVAQGVALVLMVSAILYGHLRVRLALSNRGSNGTRRRPSGSDRHRASGEIRKGIFPLLIASFILVAIMSISLVARHVRDCQDAESLAIGDNTRIVGIPHDPHGSSLSSTNMPLRFLIDAHEVSFDALFRRTDHHVELMVRQAIDAADCLSIVAGNGRILQIQSSTNCDTFQQ